MKLIDKDAVADKIRQYISNADAYLRYHTDEDDLHEMFLHQRAIMSDTLSFLDTLEVKEVDVDLDKELDKFIETNNAFVKDDSVVEKNNGDSFNHRYDLEDIAKHFFELGLKANQENNVIGILEREVKIDAGGYPCIDCYIEFYDYDKDIPLAKEGDKVKVVIIKGE